MVTFPPPKQIQSNALGALEALDERVAERVYQEGCITGDRINGLCDGVTGDWCADGPAAVGEAPAPAPMQPAEALPPAFLLAWVAWCITQLHPLPSIPACAPDLTTLPGDERSTITGNCSTPPPPEPQVHQV